MRHRLARLARSRTAGQPRSGFAWLELLLAIAALSLLFQLSPSLRSAVNVSNWSQLTWFIFNVVVVLILIGIRVGPDLWSDFSERRQRKATDQAKASKAHVLKEQREAMERMQESRRRRKF